MTPFNFEAGHVIPESKGGKTHIENLLPICSTCNKSMGNRFTIHEFSKKFESSVHTALEFKFTDNGRLVLKRTRGVIVRGRGGSAYEFQKS